MRSWPGGRKVKQSGQKVGVVGPGDGLDRGDRRAARGLAFSALELLTKGLPVTVWTEPAKVTLAAQAGAKGALAASRVVVKP